MPQHRHRIAAMHASARKPALLVAGESRASPMDMSCMVDNAYSAASWTMQSGSPSPSPNDGTLAQHDPDQAVGQHKPCTTSIEQDLAALDSMYTALASLGFQAVRDFAIT
jgi:hypothetical protein